MDHLTMGIYILQSAPFPWGDYGNILVNGMLSPRAPMKNADAKVIYLERTGPFIPPITFPYSAIIITDELRKRIETQAFVGVSFYRVVKYHIVRLDWHLWDRNSEIPLIDPAGGEPEGYLLNNPHSKEASNLMGELWQLVPTIIPSIQRKGNKFYRKEYGGEDLCRAAEWGGYVYISEKMKNWLQTEVSEWVRFTKVKVIE